jgi:hypothetical protein
LRSLKTFYKIKIKKGGENMKRGKERRSTGKKIFKRTAQRTKKINLVGNINRGGIRL